MNKKGKYYFLGKLVFLIKVQMYLSCCLFVVEYPSKLKVPLVCAKCAYLQHPQPFISSSFHVHTLEIFCVDDA